MSHVQGVQRLFFIVSPLSTVCMFSSVLGGMRYMYIYNTTLHVHVGPRST